MGPSPPPQHTENENRDRWKTTRERNRLRARFVIRHRVVAGVDEMAHDGSRDHKKNAATTTADRNNDLIQQVLYHTVRGDRSFFSLLFMAEHSSLLSSAVSTSFLLDPTNKPMIFLEQKIQSRFGQALVEQIHQFASHFQTFSFYEYAVWLKRYHIVGALIRGGINPCSRRSSKQSTLSKEQLVVVDHDEQLWRHELWQMGTLALQQFLTTRVPLRLSSYIVKRVVDLRIAVATNTDKNNKVIVPHGCCPLCERDVPKNFLLCNNDNGNSHCGHFFFCEVCWWKDVLRKLPHRDDHADVVQCPVCVSNDGETTKDDNSGDTTSASRNNNTMELWGSYTSLAPKRRAQVSREKFFALPVDSAALKRQANRKQKVSECQAICSHWSEAVRHSLGFNQAVRRDKFLAHVEQRNYHYVKGILVEGIDVGLVNEYGQTALFLAVWYGSVPLVELLLEFGSDATVTSNGGISVFAVAAVNHAGNTALHRLLQAFAPNICGDGNVACFYDIPTVQENRWKLTILIHADEEHPGAGSFIVDNAVPEHVIDRLIELWSKIPTEEQNVKKKNGPCSVRSYFCDALGWLRSQLECVLKNLAESDGENDNGGQDKRKLPIVWPHMRFLCYQEPSTSLAPHVDLCRVHPFHPELRSTHTFILYLSDCVEGGETNLLKDLAGEGRSVALASVTPKRGRLLLFPHDCPHEGEAVLDVPKLLIRGEARIHNSLASSQVS